MPFSILSVYMFPTELLEIVTTMCILKISVKLLLVGYGVGEGTKQILVRRLNLSTNVTHKLVNSL